MKRLLVCFALVLALVFVSSCSNKKTNDVENFDTTSNDTIVKETENEPITTVPEVPTLYIQGLEVDDVIRYFNEVCLDAEFSHGGDATKIQKWSSPIYYYVFGNRTAEDNEKLTSFTEWLNEIEGFPGIYETEDNVNANLRIFFGTDTDMIVRLGEEYRGCDAGVKYWYRDDVIYDAIICYRTDLDQTVRNSVILEEIYNGLGPVQDTTLRTDSIIYSGYSAPQALTEIDELILKLLYHPDIKCGMNAAECEAIIRELYHE